MTNNVYSNSISKLIKIISRELGIGMIIDKLPECIGIGEWIDVIQNDVIDLYSNYYPHKVIYQCVPDRDYDSRRDCYIIDENFINQQDLVIKDLIQISKVENNPMNFNTGFPEGLMYNTHTEAMGMDFVDMQATMNLSSMHPHHIFMEFLPPNAFRITDYYSRDVVKYRDNFYIDIAVNHTKNLLSIPPNAARTSFEHLCISKIAKLCYNTLKHMDQIETGFGVIDLKLDDLIVWKDKEEEIIEKIKESYISASNRNIPLMTII